MSKRADYIITYDISNHKRLGRLARRLEKIAIRIQYSVFFAPEVSKEDLFMIIDTINSIIDDTEDDVRIYTMVSAGIAIGKAIDLEEPMLFM